MTLEQAYNEAMRSRRKWRDAKDQRSIEGLYEAAARRFGRDRKLSTITREGLLTWIERMRGENLSASTINHRLSLLSVLFKTADVPMPKVERLTARPGRVRIITDEELARMCAALKDGGDCMHVLILFLSHTALRLSEALRLRWVDIDDTAKTVRIHDTKADLPRTIPLSDTAADCLIEMRSMGGQDGSGPFTHLTVDRCDHLWAQARKAIGLAHDPEFVIHALRHTSLTRLARAGVDASRIKAFAGHKRIETTMRYVHLAAVDLRDLARVQDGLPLVPPPAASVAARTVNP